jgi:hypothetical protein
MTISILKDFNVFDIGTPSDVETICSKLTLSDNDVTIDISKCIIDYPSTSGLVDYVINLLSSKKGEKVFQILTNLNVNELLLLHWLLIGSQFFGIEQKEKSKNLKEFKDIIVKKLSPVKIRFVISIVGKDGLILKTHTYGE